MEEASFTPGSGRLSTVSRGRRRRTGGCLREALTVALIAGRNEHFLVYSWQTEAEPGSSVKASR